MCYSKGAIYEYRFQHELCIKQISCLNFSNLVIFLCDQIVFFFIFKENNIWKIFWTKSSSFPIFSFGISCIIT